MASSLISSSHHIDFDSVFGFDDAELVQMFESLITTGLKVFLGCPAVFYEAALTEFFSNSSVRNGVVVSTIMGTAIEISEEVFATTFELPPEGLTDLSEFLRTWCLMREASSPNLRSRSFDAVTRDRFMLMTAITFDAKGYAIQICVLLNNIPGLELGESRAFPVPRVLTDKMVHRYVVINEKVGTEEVADAPRLKKTPVKKAVSQKRPAAVEVEVAPVVKKKRTTKGKPVKRKRRLVLEAEDEIFDDQPAAEAATGMQEPVVENEQAVTEPAVGTVLVEPVVEKSPVVEPAVATVVNEGPSTADDVDDIIQQVLTETAQLDTTDEGDPVAAEVLNHHLTIKTETVALQLVVVILIEALWKDLLLLIDKDKEKEAEGIAVDLIKEGDTRIE
ncbi:hypothetical protein F511_22084 [Dorcoceras hygrometricum]|uniref:Uncharacterized protein n=1 Tax=Dorcoceras hygrometricum TaxID=472368 RepID=A0A2Z7BVN3_9LAMI|nr:hypothetical protein F511_22084 [Dorcoceras hygrometricum]